MCDAGGVTTIQVADETFVAAAPTTAGEVVNDRARWRRWFTDLRLDVVEDRGDQGVRWRVAGPVEGTMEIWCEPALDGFVLHYYLHGEPTRPLPDDPAEAMALIAELNKRRRVAGKEMSFEVKAVLEGDREIGAPATGAGGEAGRG
ncbi:MAG: hypothetical protein QM809_11575 [Gordonia sp. (in: high G+C Gram-positive bacteria)]|uniref:hypothetical protein n=1 Tax=Gordonia sp. (in: high G+C Gram-positive bacteria) TaxID=84139 RepID=UPI0039E64621